MMHVMEPLFDVAYLVLVIGLGLRLLLEESSGARRFGMMAIVLGAGDAFHLIPRILAHLTPNGFAEYAALLSWGELVTSITMTFFYLLFFAYYQEMSGDRIPAKKHMIQALAAARIVFTLLPQNEWGTAGNYTFALLRNVPFLIMGLLLIRWTWQTRSFSGLEHAAELIFLSFLFYVPVVAGARFVPVLGVFMIPKTLAYVALVVSGFRHYIRGLTPSHLLKTAIVFLIMGLAGGVFYRELTKALGWTSPTSLGLVHPHSIMLGFVLMLILYLLLRDRAPAELASIRRPLRIYQTGLVWTIVGMLVRGIATMTADGISLFPDAALSGIAGIGHVFLGAGLVSLFVILTRQKTAPSV